VAHELAALAQEEVVADEHRRGHGARVGEGALVEEPPAAQPVHVDPFRRRLHGDALAGETELQRRAPGEERARQHASARQLEQDERAPARGIAAVDDDETLGLVEQGLALEGEGPEAPAHAGLARQRPGRALAGSGARPREPVSSEWTGLADQPDQPEQREESHGIVLSAASAPDRTAV
jgi:hypothetical protein